MKLDELDVKTRVAYGRNEEAKCFECLLDLSLIHI